MPPPLSSSQSSKRAPAPMYEAPALDPVGSYSSGRVSPRSVVVPSPPSARGTTAGSSHRPPPAVGGSSAARRETKREQAWVSDFHAAPIFSTFPRERSLLLSRAVAAVAADKAADSGQTTPRTKLILSDVPFCVSAGDSGTLSAGVLQNGAPLTVVAGVTPREAQSVRRSRNGGRASPGATDGGGSDAEAAPAPVLFMFGHADPDSYFTVEAVVDAPPAAEKGGDADKAVAPKKKQTAAKADDAAEKKDDAASEAPPPRLLWTVVEKPPAQKKKAAEGEKAEGEPKPADGTAADDAPQPNAEEGEPADAAAEEEEDEGAADNDAAPATAEDPDPEADQASARGAEAPPASWTVAAAPVEGGALSDGAKYLLTCGDAAAPKCLAVASPAADDAHGAARGVAVRDAPALGASLSALDDAWIVTLDGAGGARIAHAPSGQFLIARVAAPEQDPAADSAEEAADMTGSAAVAPPTLELADTCDRPWTVASAEGGFTLACEPGPLLLALVTVDAGPAGEAATIALVPSQGEAAGDGGAPSAAAGAVWRFVAVAEVSAEATDASKKEEDAADPAAAGKGEPAAGPAKKAAPKKDAADNKKAAKKKRKAGKKKEYTIVLAPAGPYQAPPPEEGEGGKEEPQAIEDGDSAKKDGGADTKTPPPEEEGEEKESASKPKDPPQEVDDATTAAEPSKEEESKQQHPDAKKDDAAAAGEEEEEAPQPAAPTAEQLWALHPMTATAKDGARLYFFTNKAHPKLYLCVGPDGASLVRRPPADVGIAGNTLVRSRRAVIEASRHDPPKPTPKAVPAPPPAKHGLAEGEQLEQGARLTSPGGEYWLTLTRAGQLRLETAEAGRERQQATRRRMKDGPAAASTTRNNSNSRATSPKKGAEHGGSSGTASPRTPRKPAGKQSRNGTARATTAASSAKNQPPSPQATPAPDDQPAAIWTPELTPAEDTAAAAPGPAGSLVLRADGTLVLLSEEGDLADPLWRCPARGEALRLTDAGRLELLERRDRRRDDDDAASTSDASYSSDGADDASAGHASDAGSTTSSQAEARRRERRDDKIAERRYRKQQKEKKKGKAQQEAAANEQQKDGDATKNGEESEMEVVWSVGVASGDDQPTQSDTAPVDPASSVAAGSGPVAPAADGVLLRLTAKATASNAGGGDVTTTLRIVNGALFLTAGPASSSGGDERTVWTAPVKKGSLAIGAVEMRADGNFVATSRAPVSPDAKSGTVAWSSCTEGSPAAKAELAPEELRLVDADGGLVWTTRPPTPAAAAAKEEEEEEEPKMDAEEDDASVSSPPPEPASDAEEAAPPRSPTPPPDDAAEEKPSEVEDARAALAPPPTSAATLVPGEVFVSADGAWVVANHRYGALAMYGGSDTAAEWSPEFVAQAQQLRVGDGAVSWGAKGVEGTFVMPVDDAAGAQLIVTNGGWLHLTREAAAL